MHVLYGIKGGNRFLGEVRGGPFGHLDLDLLRLVQTIGGTDLFSNRFLYVASMANHLRPSPFASVALHVEGVAALHGQVPVIDRGVIIHNKSLNEVGVNTLL